MERVRVLLVGPPLSRLSCTSQRNSYNTHSSSMKYVSEEEGGFTSAPAATLGTFWLHWVPKDHTVLP